MGLYINLFPFLVMSAHSRKKEQEEIYTYIYIWKLAFQIKVFLPNDQDMLEVFIFHAYHLLKNLGKSKQETMLKQIGVQKKIEHSLRREVEKGSHSA